jgi:thiamine biosynthesis protein ThiI
MVPRKPATAATREALEREEAKLDPATLERALAARTLIDLRALDPDKISIPELEVNAVPDGATVIDLRSRAAFAGWHWPGALQLDLDRALASYPGFARDARYVLVCEFGLKSAHVAERMRRDGFDASNFHAGLRGLLAHAEERGLASRELLGL